MTASESASAAVKPVVRARRIRFSYPTGSLQRHFVDGDLVMSHVVAHLSALFPEGEDFFVRSVRRFADQITDPELKSRVQGFIGQEVSHGREHRALNERLQQMGYPTRRIDRITHRDFKRFERLLSPLTCLAITAAIRTLHRSAGRDAAERRAGPGHTRVNRGAIDAAVARHRGIRTPVGSIRRLPSVGGTEPGVSGLCGSSSSPSPQASCFSPPFPSSVTAPRITRSGCSAVCGIAALAAIDPHGRAPDPRIHQAGLSSRRHRQHRTTRALDRRTIRRTRLTVDHLH